MVLAKVVGSLWATKKVEALNGLKLLITQHLNLDGSRKNVFTVAADTVGAGAGETVLICSGSSARMTEKTKDKPVDSVVMAIVDTVDVWDKE